MIISLFTDYGANNSKPVFEAVEHSLKLLGHRVIHNSRDADMYVIWSILWQGKMKPNYEIYHNSDGIPVMVLEVGMLKRNITWRVRTTLPEVYTKRSDILGVELKPWKNNGKYILICGQNTHSENWRNMPTIEEWLRNTIKTIRQYSSRPIIYRPHPRCLDQYHGIVTQFPKQVPDTYDSYDFERSLSNVWCVVNPSSNTGVEAIINGIPAIVNENSLGYTMSTLIEDIENPYRPDRTEWFEKLCNTEYTIDELRNPDIIQFLITDRGQDHVRIQTINQNDQN